MTITLKNGMAINLISPGEVNHTIDDLPENTLQPSSPALLYVEEATTVKVTYANGVIASLTDYNNYPAVLVIKVWASGTSDSSKVKLFE